jgi:hypothetical protein
MPDAIMKEAIAAIIQGIILFRNKVRLVDGDSELVGMFEAV